MQAVHDCSFRTEGWQKLALWFFNHTYLDIYSPHKLCVLPSLIQRSQIEPYSGMAKLIVDVSIAWIRATFAWQQTYTLYHDVIIMYGP